ncbi:MAG: hypothetical protein Q8N59_02920 [bacterium]|nr:hypothetical protein [bacterium]
METKKSFKENILEQIKSGKIKMRPKVYFILRPIIFVFLLIIVTVAVIYLISFMFFAMRINGGAFVFSFGFQGIWSIVRSLPWALILVALFFIVLLEMILIQSDFVYRRPILYSFFALVILLLIGSFFLNRTHFHTNLFFANREGKLPVFGPLYTRYGKIDFNNVHAGIIFEKTNQGFIIKDPDGDDVSVIVPDRLQFKCNPMRKGDLIMVIGEEIALTIDAEDFLRIEERHPMFQFRMFEMK